MLSSSESSWRRLVGLQCPLRNSVKGLFAVLSSPCPRIALEVGVASKFIAESSLSVLWLECCCPDAREDFSDNSLHPLTRADYNPYPGLATIRG